ncbi:hypothetical protein FJV41_44445 [Myxococcus llanfairpwllgwyngyllgogerychwyrndrobwllllantysiliogogogochensis]|uniref:Uncharacterized protein n=1 Tax=Myxococcus llanfairpwllgwyngyllgogerychwyrndrobwllllantysiliogogogochensis TaxID=2590453 RepID=A0A540WKC6_9BACT|nr:hypothetical protein [Myxococcus llanfairpwllgwyngyllgogerychwyrndrobwllllantysiliogogogochensis]TQF09465.1 hypothetical protein FJV41_44445 [Myxococcus llanfairpwllgwyngyllgogerychwyrndrobwllllantysiliogogogochensis]
MSRRTSLSFLAMLSVFTCLYAGESFAQNTRTGTANDGTYITVPSGTVNDWVIHVSPQSMGFEEPGSEGDNALIKIECYAVQINQYTWQVVARYKYRPWSGRDGYWNGGSANYLLVHK